MLVENNKIIGDINLENFNEVKNTKNQKYSIKYNKINIIAIKQLCNFYIEDNFILFLAKNTLEDNKRFLQYFKQHIVDIINVINDDKNSHIFDIKIQKIFNQFFAILYQMTENVLDFINKKINEENYNLVKNELFKAIATIVSFYKYVQDYPQELKVFLKDDILKTIEKKVKQKSEKPYYFVDFNEIKQIFYDKVDESLFSIENNKIPIYIKYLLNEFDDERFYYAMQEHDYFIKYTALIDSYYYMFKIFGIKEQSVYVIFDILDKTEKIIKSVENLYDNNIQKNALYNPLKTLQNSLNVILKNDFKINYDYLQTLLLKFYNIEREIKEGGA